MTASAPSSYAGHRFPSDVISHAVWLHFWFPLGLRHVNELLTARGLQFGQRVRQGLDHAPFEQRRALIDLLIDPVIGADATPGTLATAEGLRSSNLAKALKDLEAQGVITRQLDDDDRRRVRVALTAEGRVSLNEVRGRRDRWLAGAIAATLSDAERATLIAAGELLSKLARAP